MILNPSEKLVRALIDLTTNEVILWLFTIVHAESGQVHLLTNNRENVVSQGRDFEPFPIEFSLPDDDESAITEISIVLKSAESELIDLIRRYAGGIEITAELVLASDPNQIEYSVDALEVKTAQYNRAQVELIAKPESVVDQRCPADDYLPSTFRGMFK